MRIYRSNERHEFDPGPCPKCGGAKHRVNWVDVHESHEVPGSVLIPGTIECLNPDCEWGPNAGVLVTQPGDTWEART
jgi:hypothetical protein